MPKRTQVDDLRSETAISCLTISFDDVETGQIQHGGLTHFLVKPNSAASARSRSRVEFQQGNHYGDVPWGIYTHVEYVQFVANVRSRLVRQDLTDDLMAPHRMNQRGIMSMAVFSVVLVVHVPLIKGNGSYCAALPSPFRGAAAPRGVACEGLSARKALRFSLSIENQRCLVILKSAPRRPDK